MQKVTFNNSRGIKLVGAFYPKKSNNAIILSHGFSSNKDRPRSISLAEELSKEFAVLRFDSSGCGESEAATISVNSHLDDLKSAINFLKEKNYTKFGLLGESFGALLSILAYNESVKTMVLLAPVSKGKTPSSAKMMGDKDTYSFFKDGRKFTITRDYIEERKNINQKEILSNVKCPVLIVHGTEDEFVPTSDSEEAIKYLSEESKLEIIKNGDHKLISKMDEIIPLTVNWFKEHLT